jgi:hypothetical protein
MLGHAPGNKRTKVTNNVTCWGGRRWGAQRATWDTKFDNVMTLCQNKSCPGTKKVVQENKQVVQEQKKFFEKIGK